MTTENGNADHEDRPKNFAVIGIMFTLQVVFIVLFATLADYGEDSLGDEEQKTDTEKDKDLSRLYPFFQDVHVMIFIGFGFLMTFMRRYTMSAVGFNMLVAAYMIQWTILVVSFWHRAFLNDFTHKIELKVEDLVKADFGAGTVLITFGALLGKVGPLQMVILGLFEIIAYGLNEAIGVEEFEAVDMGGSMFVHMFGAFFGLAASFTFMRADEVNRRKRNGGELSTPISDTFAMIGTLFLWMFWPSFNGALAVGAARNRVVINTVLSLCSSCCMAFMGSYLFRSSGRFSMVDIQNATLAGGVAVGSSSDLVVDAWPALLVGAIAGLVSAFGYVYITPFLEKTIGLHDTCGVLNLHGIPGVIGAVSGCISAASAGTNLYGQHIGNVFPARVDGARSASYQGAMQASCLFTTLGISLASGLIGGYLIRLMPDLSDASDDRIFEDAKYWEIEEDGEEEPEESAAVAVEVKEDAMESANNTPFN